jgi:predicted metal-dependent hydrolase
MTNRGHMTLNTKLIFSPLFCLDYVIFHELCHLKCKNHSKKFYDLQEKFIPNWKDIKKNHLLKFQSTKVPYSKS